MSDEYPIVTVEPEWVINPEEMGGKTKFWYGKPDDNTNWLFKYPRPNTGEHWAEKIASESCFFDGDYTCEGRTGGVSR